MLLTLRREILLPDCTHGVLFRDGAFECYTLEDTDRNLDTAMSWEEIMEKKFPGETAIPYGEYEVIINQSNRFKRLMPLLLNVMGFEGIRIHYGNSAADTSGCILVGAVRDDKTVLVSKYAYNNLFPMIRFATEHGKCFMKIER